MSVDYYGLVRKCGRQDQVWKNEEEPWFLIHFGVDSIQAEDIARRVSESRPAVEMNGQDVFRLTGHQVLDWNKKVSVELMTLAQASPLIATEAVPVIECNPVSTRKEDGWDVFSVDPNIFQDNTWALMGCFDRQEREVSAMYVLRLCQQKGGWYPVTKAELDEAANEDYRFNDLDKNGYVDDRGNGTYNIRQAFIQRCLNNATRTDLPWNNLIREAGYSEAA